MTLQHELTTLPPSAVTILRFMTQLSGDAADAPEIQQGTGLSHAGFNKALKRLVTRNFLSMDEARFYHVTSKGRQAIELLQELDAQGPKQEDQGLKGVPYDLCVVIPEKLSQGQSATFQIGLHPTTGEQVEHPTDVYLRIRTTNADVSPDEAILSLGPNQKMASTELEVAPETDQSQVRIRVEALQLFEMDEPANAGGMYFDVSIGADTGHVRSIHAPVAFV
ncbi:MAG: hypothetical protein GYB66_08135 [Chloroflexi bacterium]|nr:hypothetical protein [Chloroflexota bacterium]